MIQPTGMRGANRATGIGRGIGKILNITNTTLTGEVYFEGHPDQLNLNLGSYQESMIVELYGGIDFGLDDCTEEGIMLGHRLVIMSGIDDVVSNFNYTVDRFDDYNSVLIDESIECHPRSTNGRLGKINFSLQDPFYYNEQSPSLMNLWYPFRTNAEFGNMEFCIHIEMIDPTYESEDDDFNDDYFRKRNVTYYMDTKFKVEVSAPDAANDYTRFREEVSEVKVYSNKPFGPVEGVTNYLPERYNENKATTTASTESPTSAPTMPTEIVLPAKTFLCGSPDESDIPGVYKFDRTFRLGQTFRMCVGPSLAYKEDYRVIGIQNIVCENSFRNTTIIDEHGAPNLFTMVERDTIGYTKKMGGIVTSDHVISINSVITGDLAGAFDGGDNYFVCNGIVYFESTLKDDPEMIATEAATLAPTPTSDGTLEKMGASSSSDTEEEEDSRLRSRPDSRSRHLVASVSRSLQVDEADPIETRNNQELVDQWDKIESNPNLPIVGSLSIRIDITPEPSNPSKVTTFVNKSVNKVKDWFTSSSASHNSLLGNDYGIHIFCGTSGLLSLLLFA